MLSITIDIVILQIIITKVKMSLKFSFIHGLSNAIDFENMITLSFRNRYVQLMDT
ncbi:hypothetical protein [Staphylococcus saccharolyticus]|uniref:hypothetical protein n=1 Tax=Staphylococcus saccharolyticus TaxID=33028 RepID=UPI0013EECFE2|nr:hypothetical protein [Staphylococcus saccharolyticus]MBL7574160.1 hypothetical protein [Staphylococcus saccharolyticus]MBL7585162.1 hypothetical protein [Staphylococcus saccharolyticus]MBL7639772.1 hypothetical protein [Staphylococcus saccharolyticus]QRJ68935.1 hypothetical protein DMB75_003835 [Staphylococcus saccharolyticus]